MDTLLREAAPPIAMARMQVGWTWSRAEGGASKVESGRPNLVCRWLVPVDESMLSSSCPDQMGWWLSLTVDPPLECRDVLVVVGAMAERVVLLRSVVTVNDILFMLMGKRRNVLKWPCTVLCADRQMDTAGAV